LQVSWPVTLANRLDSYKYSKILITARLGSVSSSTTTPHSPTEKALHGAQLPWVPSLLISSAQLADLRTKGSLIKNQKEERSRQACRLPRLSLCSCKHSEVLITARQREKSLWYAQLPWATYLFVLSAQLAAYLTGRLAMGPATPDVPSEMASSLTRAMHGGSRPRYQDSDSTKQNSVSTVYGVTNQDSGVANQN
jgi:hypothetical protein